MASWADKSPEFNPYIQQLPVDAMVKVGMQKQQQYNEGVQKIQNNIDSVAGMDVIRDVDKQYLQSKLNQLGNKLKGVAAADFSNFQLVNSVSGMTNQIAKDKNVLNAVSSTMKYRNEVQNLEKAKQDGKSSIQNEWDFNNKANEWLNSNDVSQSFNGTYTPYIDVNKKWLDIYKGLHSDLTEQDIPYETNLDGSINLEKTAAVMQRISKETVSAAQIENAIRSSLTPDEQNQLSINGKYEFRQYDDPQKLSVYSISKYNNKKQQIDNQIEKLKGLSTLSGSNASDKEKYDNVIKSLEAQRSQIPSMLQDELDLIEKNPDYAKYTIYKNGAIEQFAQANSWEHNKIKLMDNPMLSAEHWERDFKLKQEQFNWNKEKFYLEQKQKEEDKKKEEGSVGGFTVLGGVSTKTKDPYVAFRDDIISYKEDSNNQFNKLVDLYSKNKKINKSESVNILTKALDEYEKGNTSLIPDELSNYADKYIESKRNASFMQQVLDNEKSNVENSPEFLQKTQEINNELSSLNNGKGIAIPDVNSPDGYMEFSNKEIFDYLNKENKQKKYKYSPSFSMGVGGQKSDVTSFPEELISNDRERKLYQYLKDIRYDYKSPLRPDQKLVKQRIEAIDDIVDKNNNITKEINQKVSDNLSDNISGWAPEEASIETPKTESRYKYEGIVTSVISKYNEKFAGIPGGAEEFDNNERETLSEWIQGEGKDDLHYAITQQSDKHFLTVKKGDERIDIPLTQQEYAQLPKNENSLSPQERQIQSFRTAGGGVTNITGEAKDAMFRKSDFSNINKLDVRADFQQVYGADSSMDNLIQFRLNVSKDKSNPEWLFLQLPKKHILSIRNSIDLIKTATDNDILQLYLDPNNGLSDSQRKKVLALVQPIKE